MRTSSIEEYLKLDDIYDSEERHDLHSRFPHVVVIEGDFPEVGVAHLVSRLSPTPLFSVWTDVKEMSQKVEKR